MGELASVARYGRMLTEMALGRAASKTSRVEKIGGAVDVQQPTQYGTTLEREIAAIRGMSSTTPMSSLRQAYQQARGEVDFAHIEGDVTFKASGKVKAEGGHFSSSPQLERILGTETVSPNGVIYGQVKLRGSDGILYLKSNNKGFSTMTPDSWSLPRAKGEMSQAWVNRSFDPVESVWSGRSSAVDFVFYPQSKKAPLWRGHPVQP